MKTSSEEFNRYWHDPLGSHMVYSNPRVCAPCVSTYGEALAQYTFVVTDFSTGLPVKGAQCAIMDRMAMTLQQRFDGAGCITGADGTCSIPPPTFPVNYYSVYKAGYKTVRGSVPGYLIEVALVPTDLMYWVSVGAGVGGKVKPSGTFQVEANTKLTVTAEPNEGYILDYWLVNGKKAGATNPLSVIIDRDSFSINAIFKVSDIPPPPPPTEWPVTRRMHAFDSYRLKANSWEIAKKKTWPGPSNVDMPILLGGKLEYTVSYLQGTPLAENADIYFNGSLIVRERLNKGETKTGSFDLTGLIFSSNTTTIGIVSAPGFWSEVLFDVWVTLGYSEEPVIEPGAPEPPFWEKLTWWQWLLIGGVALAGVIIVTKRGKPVIVITPERE